MCEGRCVKEILLKKEIFISRDSYSFASKRLRGFGASKDEMKPAVRRIKCFLQRENEPGASSSIRSSSAHSGPGWLRSKADTGTGSSSCSLCVLLIPRVLLFPGQDAVPAAPACSLQPAGLVLPLQVVLPPLPAPEPGVELQAGHPDPRHPGHLSVRLHRLHRRPLAPEPPR